MPSVPETQIGWRIRQLRRQRSLTQTDLAEALGISSSYLNLIEHNRRKVTVPLLFSIAGYFGVEPGELGDGDGARLVGDLLEAFSDEVFADTELTNLEIRDLANANPGVARAVLRLYDRMRANKVAAPEGARDGGDEAEPFHPSTDRISDFLQNNGNYFAALETAAERVRVDIDNASENFDFGLETYLLNVFGLQVRLGSLPRNVARSYDEGARRLTISDLVAPETARFLIAHHLAGMAADGEIANILDEAGLLEGDARPLARNALSAYFAAAVIMPYVEFHRACRDLRYDIDRLGRRFGASFEQVCHRMTSLQRPGLSGIPMHLVRTDIAGNISKRFSLSGLHIPRHSGACPRWNVYSAFLSPDRINVQVSEMPDGQRFFCLARTVSKGDHRYNALRRYLSIGIGCSIVHAKQMIYSDGVDLGMVSQIVPVGTGCRTCPRMECDHRAHPPATHRFQFSQSDRPVSIYSKI